MKLYKSFSFHYAPAPYNSNFRYTFEFSVRRIVYLTSITVIRTCYFAISEKEPTDTEFTKGKDILIHVNELKSMNYSFVPNVKYAFTTADCSFQCRSQCCQHPKFRNYFEMQNYFNRVATATACNFNENDPFSFETPQNTLIKTITYKMK